MFSPNETAAFPGRTPNRRERERENKQSFRNWKKSYKLNCEIIDSFPNLSSFERSTLDDAVGELASREVLTVFKSSWRLVLHFISAHVRIIFCYTAASKKMMTTKQMKASSLWGKLWSSKNTSWAIIYGFSSLGEIWSELEEATGGRMKNYWQVRWL